MNLAVNVRLKKRHGFLVDFSRSEISRPFGTCPLGQLGRSQWTETHGPKSKPGKSASGSIEMDYIHLSMQNNCLGIATLLEFI